jgi:prolipoprotein diacylglyceryltransferase
MANNKAFHRATFLVFLLSTLYYGVFFAFIFIVNNVLIEIISSGKIDLSSKSLIYLSVVSAIVGVAAGARVWLFAKLDERKAENHPEYIATN